MLQCGTDEQLKIELLSQWKLETEFGNTRNFQYTSDSNKFVLPFRPKSDMDTKTGQYKDYMDSIWTNCPKAHFKCKMMNAYKKQQARKLQDVQAEKLKN